MSTLSSLYYTDSKSADGKLETLIHVAEDLADGDVVIEIRGLPFDAFVSRDALELRLPLKIWATIRAHTPPNERYLTISDTELRDEAEVWVKHRISEFDPASPISGISGAGIAGMASDPFEVQVARYVAYHAVIRDGGTPWLDPDDE